MSNDQTNETTLAAGLTPAEALQKDGSHFSIEVYEAVQDVLLDLLEAIQGLETREAVAALRDFSGMLHGRAWDVEGLALCRIHGLALTDENRDQMVSEHPNPEAAIDAWLHPERNAPTTDTSPEELAERIEFCARILEDWVQAGPDTARVILDGTEPGGLPLLEKLCRAFEAARAALNTDEELSLIWEAERDRVEDEAKAANEEERG